MKTARKSIVIVMQILAGLIWIPFWFVASGTVCIQWHGFGVDAAGNIYVGQEGAIEVYHEGQHIGEIIIPRFRSYRMTVEGDIVVVTTSQFVHRYDMYGHVVSSVEDIGGERHSYIGQRIKYARSEDGTEYKAQTFMRHQILRDDGTVVYQMPVLDYSIKLFYIVCCVSFAGLGVIGIAKKKTS